MRFMISMLVVSIVLSAPTVAAAQDGEPLLPGSKGAAQESSDPGPLPEREFVVEPEEEPSSAEEDDAPDSEPAKASQEPTTPEPVDPRPTRGNFDGMMMLGVGAVSMPGTDTDSGFAPGFFLGHRSAFLFSDQFGMRWSSRFFLHDFQAIGDYYNWYNQGSSEDVELKYALLWPGLLFGPFIGANYGTGLGFILYTSPRNPSLYFDAGIGLDLFLNPSDSFGADVGLSADVSIGVDFNEVVGMGALFSWGTPFFHGFFDGGGDAIPTLVVYLSIL